MNDGQKCRKRRWRPGTVLQGRETHSDGSFTDSTIQITAVGVGMVLAREIRDGEYQRETLWTLGCRSWRKTGFLKVRN